MGIRTKLLVVVVGALFLAVLANTVVSERVFKKHYADSIRTNALTIGRSLELELERLLHLGIALTELTGFDQQCENLREKHPAVAYVLVQDLQGRDLFSSIAQHLDARALDASFPSATARAGTHLTEVAGRSYFEAVLDVRDLLDNLVGQIRVGIPRSAVQAKLDQLALISALAAVVVVVIAGAVLAFILRPVLTDRLEKLAGAMRLFTDGGLTAVPRLTDKGEDELAALSTAFNQMISQLTQAQAHAEADARALEKLALYDPLTELPNRSHFLEQAQRRLERSRSEGSEHALLFIDLDRFKIVNDTRGHLIGDQLLKSISQRLRSVAGEQCLLARLSGDEFVVLLEGIGATANVGSFCRDILALFDEPYVLSGHSMTVSASIGVSLFPTDAGDVKTLLSYADMAMYRAKHDGHSDYRFFDPEMKARLQEFNLIENRLRKALQDRDIRVHFQPEYSVTEKRFTGFEALTRWPERHFGPIDTEQIIEIAEESGLIIQLGEQMRRIACETAAAMQRFGQPVSLAVNVSILELLQQDFAQRLFKLLDDTGLDPSLLQLEITENLFHRHGHRELEALEALRAAGIKLAIDDFGKGFSSLSRLQFYPIDSLKIDRSFVARLGSDAKVRAVVASIVALGHNLGMEVIAEGVETQEQFEILAELRTDQMQGFLFHPALPAADAERLIQLQANSEAPATIRRRLEVVSSEPKPRAGLAERSGVAVAHGGADIASRNHRGKGR